MNTKSTRHLSSLPRDLWDRPGLPSLYKWSTISSILRDLGALLLTSCPREAYSSQSLGGNIPGSCSSRGRILERGLTIPCWSRLGEVCCYSYLTRSAEHLTWSLPLWQNWLWDSSPDQSRNSQGWPHPVSLTITHVWHIRTKWDVGVCMAGVKVSLLKYCKLCQEPGQRDQHVEETAPPTRKSFSAGRANSNIQWNIAVIIRVRFVSKNHQP